MSRTSADVVIIGGGPAGTAAAISLLGTGRTVLICEASPFPRTHIGISLSQGVPALLASLGLDHLLGAPCHHQGLAIERKWAAPQFDRVEGREGFIADRGRLDADLLTAASEAGATVLQPARVLTTLRQGGDWRTEAETPEGPVTIVSRFVIDARGRASSARQRRRKGVPTLAIAATWRGDFAPTIRIASRVDAWLWSAPTATGQCVTLIFTSPAHFKQLDGSPAARYRQLIAGSNIQPDDLDMVGEPVLCDATPYLGEITQDGPLAIGDADVALDPLSSSGFQAAFQSGVSVGPVVNTLLGAGETSAAWAYWQQSREARATTHMRWSAELYAEAASYHDTLFWHERTSPVAPPPDSPAIPPLPQPDQHLRLSAAAQLAPAPCIVGAAVVWRRAVHHPRLHLPVAFVDGVDLAQLVDALSSAMSARALVTRWALRVGTDRAVRLLGWLWRNRILVEADESIPRASELRAAIEHDRSIIGLEHCDTPSPIVSCAEA